MLPSPPLKFLLVNYRLHTKETRQGHFIFAKSTEQEANKRKGVYNSEQLFPFYSIRLSLTGILPSLSCICTHCCQMFSSGTGWIGSQRCLWSATHQTCNAPLIQSVSSLYNKQPLMPTAHLAPHLNYNVDHFRGTMTPLKQ